ncbi:MAG: FAD-dependent oxidoreductase, partial [Pseudomonadota bacterium]
YRLHELDPAFAALEPIGGQMLSVAPLETGPRRTIRSQHLYIVPKSDRIVIGATSEPGRALTAPEPGAIAQLRAEAIEICPVLAEAPVLETWAGIRPGFKNHAPALGQTLLKDLYVATGHYRNGILLAPLTAQWMADMILDGTIAPLCSAFLPDTQRPAPSPARV